MASGSSTLDTHTLLANALGQAQSDNESRLRRIRWQQRDVILGVAVLLMWRLGMSWDRSWMESIPQFYHIFLAAGFPALWMLLYPCLVAKHRGVREIFSPFKARNIGREMLFMLPVAALVIGLLAAISSMSVYFGGDPLGTTHDTSLRSDVFALLFLSITVTPFAEEMFFRGFFYNSLRRKSGIWIAMISQAGLFALMHPYSVSRILVVFLLGLMFGAVYEWRKTLIAPILVHVSINTLAAVATVLMILVQFSTPYMGMRGTTTEQGYVVEMVEPAGPAAAAGIMPGDVIVTIAGEKGNPNDSIALRLAAYKAGDVIPVEIERSGQRMTVDVTLTTRPRD